MKGKDWCVPHSWWHKKESQTHSAANRDESCGKKISQKSGAGTEDFHTPILKCFDSLWFLVDGDDISAFTTNLNIKSSNDFLTVFFSSGTLYTICFFPLTSSFFSSHIILYSNNYVSWCNSLAIPFGDHHSSRTYCIQPSWPMSFAVIRVWLRQINYVSSGNLLCPRTLPNSTLCSTNFALSYGWAFTVRTRTQDSPYLSSN